MGSEVEMPSNYTIAIGQSSSKHPPCPFRPFCKGVVEAPNTTGGGNTIKFIHNLTFDTYTGLRQIVCFSCGEYFLGKSERSVSDRKPTKKELENWKKKHPDVVAQYQKQKRWYQFWKR